MRRHGVFRPRNVKPSDTRSPMRRLLEDGRLPDGMVAVNYAEQWATLGKAQRLGYIDERQYITPAGRAFLESNAK